MHRKCPLCFLQTMCHTSRVDLLQSDCLKTLLCTQLNTVCMDTVTHQLHLTLKVSKESRKISRKGSLKCTEYWSYLEMLHVTGVQDAAKMAENTRSIFSMTVLIAVSLILYRSL
uniref:Uncharacterized protein n=1 Tax=Rhipicephalus zambeziensis TaxID=60191 RepID=A0A224YI13_9ACAR